MYGVLGLDPINYNEKDGNKRESKSQSNVGGNNGLRSYGLSTKLFLTENESAEAKNDFVAKLKLIDAEKKYNLKYLEY